MGARLQGAVQGRVDPAEVRVFWIALVAFPILWGLLFIVALFGFKFRWLVRFYLILISMAFNLENFKFARCNLCLKISL